MRRAILACLTCIRHLIIAYNTSIQVYSAMDSLLVRRIPITVVESSAEKPATAPIIAAMRISKQNSNFVWVACSDGRVFHVDWTTTEAPESFQTRSGTAKALVVFQSDNTQDVLLVAEADKSSRVEIVAYEGNVQSMVQPKVVLEMKKAGTGLQILESSRDGQVLAGAINDRLFIGVPTQEQTGTLEGLKFEFFSFDAPELITALDVRVYARSSSKKARANPAPVVDVIVGGARGSIYLYHDVLSRSQALGKPGSDKDMIQAQKYHWHRRAVHALKWSLDGMC